MVYRSTPGGRSSGTVSVLCRGQTEIRSRRPNSSAIAVRHDRYIWRAPRDAREPLPIDRSVRFDVYTAADGIRRFVPCPEDGLDGYVARAFQYGHSLLARDRNFDWCRWCEYLVGKLAYDRLLHVQERVRRTFNSADSLKIETTFREPMGRSNLLPEKLGRSAAGAGQSWTIDRLLDEGRRAAQEDGVQSPTGADAVNYGLFAAARLNPLRIGERRQVSALMRMALYDFSHIESQITPAEREEVWQRFHDLIRLHLNDELEIFQGWLAGGSSNVIKAIANQRDGSGQRMPQPVVKRALHDLGWRGYERVAECLEVFARAFARSLQGRLRQQELRYFQAMYYRQEYLGGLPLVLMMDRSAQIQPAVARLWEQPEDADTIGALHQVLRWYAEMVPLRREADRLAKPGAQGQPSCLLPLDEEICPTIGNGPSADELFRHLLERRRLRCSQCDESPHAILATEDIQSGSPIRLQIRCETHGDVGIVEIPWDELEATRPVFADQRRPALNRSDRRRGVQPTIDWE